MTAHPSVGRPAAQPAAAQEPPAPPSAHAGVVTRVLAACVDLAGVFLATVLLDLGAAGIRFAWSPLRFRWPQPGPLLTAVVIVGVAVAYLTVAWAMTGRSYGARLLGLRVLSGRYAPLGWTRSFLRALACVVFPAGLLWSAVSRTRRSVQDVVLRTLVVYDSRDHPATPATGRP